MAKKSPDLHLVLACPVCAGDTFTLLLLKDEGIGVARCSGCERHFLLLDSGDYWFDAIQARYPSATRCGCKAMTFNLRADYWRREEGGDVSQVQLWSTCTQCARLMRQLAIHIDYGDTQDLVDIPLHPCAQPKLLYDLRELTTYAPAERIADLVQYLHAQERCAFFANVREDGRWVPRALEAEEAVARILGAERGTVVPYLWLYAMPVRLEVPDEVGDAKKEARWWKRNEVIRISAPFSIGGSTMYYLRFANERVEGEEVQPKSEAFRALTQRLLEHLAAHFVSWRGDRSFDDVEEHRRAFGERFRKGTQEA